MWTVAKLVNEGLRAQGAILGIGPAQDRSTVHYVAGSAVQYCHRIRVGVRFPDGRSAEFDADVPDHLDWDPDPPSSSHGACYDPITNMPMQASRRPRDPGPRHGPAPQPIPLTFEVGGTVPVRHDPHRRRFVVDLVTLRMQVVAVWLPRADPRRSCRPGDGVGGPGIGWLTADGRTEVIG